MRPASAISVSWPPFISTRHAGRMRPSRDAEAISELQRAVYLSPYDNEAHLLLGRIYLRGGRLPDAIDALKISIWSSETAAARLTLADVYVKAGMLDEARAELRALLARDAANAEARQRLDDLSGR